MLLSVESIKKICLESGIRWDENAESSTLCGVPVFAKDIPSMFGSPVYKRVSDAVKAQTNVVIDDDGAEYLSSDQFVCAA